MDTYLVTSDNYEASIGWLPQIFGTLSTPVGYTLRFNVPEGANVISSGKYIRRETIEDSDGSRALYIYKSKPRPEKQKLDTAALLDKIGFIIGHFPYYSVFEQELVYGRSRTQIQLGLAMFASHQKHELFEAKNFYKQQIYSILKSMKDDIMKTEHPCKIQEEEPTNQHHLKMLFVPNLFLRKQEKQSLNFANCLHIFDENVLLPRNVIEKRHHIYKTLATSLSYDYFGNQVWEETSEDAWLVTGLRERIGDYYKMQKCGKQFYRYTIAKRMRKFYKKVKANAERFSLSSKHVPHFQETEYSEDIYLLKCQLIMHMINQLFPEESKFLEFIRELYNHSKPTLSIELFKKQLKDIGFNRQQFK